jgi:hypothetical protein
MQIYKTISEYRKNKNMNSELKWTKISNQKFSEYKILLDYFFALNNTNKIQFHCIIFDNHLANHAKYNSGEKDIGLSKLYFQLILHKFVKLHGNDNSLFVCLDHRNSKTPLDDLKSMINSTAKRDFGFLYPVKELVSRDSKKEDMLQLNDILLGAVCAVRNGKHLLAETRDAKKKIAVSVLEQSGLGSFNTNSSRHVNRFTVWNMQPRSR